MNKEYQQTIKRSITVSGVGLHTGSQVDMTFNPAAPNHGYKFRRIDLAGQPIIEADADLVIDTARGTTIARNGASVSTICLLYTSPSPRDRTRSRMPSSA